jgi:hypothetical protein
MSINFSSHPYVFIEALLARNPNISDFEFSRYIYVPQTTIDERRIFHVDASKLTNSFVENLIKNLGEGEELAFHSVVHISGDNRTLHIPLVDMSTSAKAHLEKLEKVLPKNLFESFMWFKSGRSFHGYSTILLEPEEWTKYMGLLLLCNLPNLPPTVDPRWVGHRLVAGYGALRWSKNTAHYLQLPSKVDSLYGRS